MKEITIKIFDNISHRQEKHSAYYEDFEVFVDGKKIPRLHRFSLDFVNNPDKSAYQLETDFIYHVEQFVDTFGVCDE